MRDVEYYKHIIDIECPYEDLEKIDTFINEVLGYEWDDEEEMWRKYDKEKEAWVQ